MVLGRKFNPNWVPNVKASLHLSQIILVFVLWCMEIAVWRDNDAKINGNNAWPFGLAFLSIFAWIYNLASPRVERARRLCSPAVMLIVDIIFTICWISAFATQASYNSAGSCGGACNVSKGIVGLGVVVSVSWALCVAVSYFTFRHYQLTGTLAGYENNDITPTNPDDHHDPDKSAFSMAPHDEEYAPVNTDDRHDTSNRYDSDTHYGGSGNTYSGSTTSHTPNPFQQTTSPHPYPNQHSASVVSSQAGGGNGGYYDQDTQYYSNSGMRENPDPYAIPRQPSTMRSNGDFTLNGGSRSHLGGADEFGMSQPPSHYHNATISAAPPQLPHPTASAVSGVSGFSDMTGYTGAVSSLDPRQPNMSPSYGGNGRDGYRDEHHEFANLTFPKGDYNRI